MVEHLLHASTFVMHRSWQLLLAAEDSTEPLLMRLDPQRRAKVLMALLGLVLLGVALMMLAWIGGRYLRRIAGKPTPPTQPREENWYRKPLHPQESETSGGQENE